MYAVNFSTAGIQRVNNNREEPTGHQLQLHELSQNQSNQFIKDAGKWKFINGKIYQTGTKQI